MSPPEIADSVRCAKCSEPLVADGAGFSHPDANRRYGHVADPGDEYRERKRQELAALRRRTPDCIYCGSQDTEDCGHIGNGEHHIECNSCRCAFPWRTHIDGSVPS